MRRRGHHHGAVRSCGPKPAVGVPRFRGRRNRPLQGRPPGLPGPYNSGLEGRSRRQRPHAEVSGLGRHHCQHRALRLLARPADLDVQRAQAGASVQKPHVLGQQRKIHPRLEVPRRQADPAVGLCHRHGLDLSGHGGRLQVPRGQQHSALCRDLQSWQEDAEVEAGQHLPELSGRLQQGQGRRDGRDRLRPLRPRSVAAKPRSMREFDGRCVQRPDP
mmetsp:Transcript_44215/g.122937  ORF Transcript_44215/g.122937 Transcript_44215/m.122937 type:complete len:217 (+) Transcript_44215:762-1412(+)